MTIRVQITFADESYLDTEVDPEILLRHRLLIEKGLEGAELIAELWSDDTGPKPKVMRMLGSHEGRMVDISIHAV